ncbi:echinoidin-like [Glandiceps talaboti]
MYNKDEAQQFCEGLDPPGILANLKTKEIDEAVRHFIMEQEMNNQDCVHHYGFWIGLGDAEEEGNYVWSDGDPMCEGSYTNWAPGEPDNNDKHDPDGQDCVQLWFRSGNKLLWDDEYCDYRAKGLVCEVSIDYVDKEMSSKTHSSGVTLQNSIDEDGGRQTIIIYQLPSVNIASDTIS